MAKSYADLWKEAADLGKEGEDVANFKETVTKLPYQLKDEFRKAQDPKLDEAINKAQSDTFGAAIKGLNMYKDISDPFARRDLAETYQGIQEQGWKNLTDERTRRQGVYADYISKWTGLFGAEAAKKQDLFNNKMMIWEKEKGLADTEESKRRWEIENARAERGSGSKEDPKLFWAYAQNELNASVGSDGKYDPNVYRKIRDEAVQYGIGKTAFDTQLSSGMGDWEYKGLGIALDEESPSEQLSRMKLEEAKRDAELKAKATANQDDYYWSGTTVKKKKKGIFGIDWLSADESVKSFK